MKNLFKYSKLVLGSATVAVNLAVSSPQAIAFSLNWNLDNAEFPDSTFATGSFDYDADTTTYSSVGITTAANGSFPGRTYNTSDIASSDASSLVLNVGNETLTLNFQSPLTNAGGTIALVDTLSKEEITSPSFGSRKFIDGELSAVPFEFSPALGIIACLCWFGIPILKNKLN